MSITINKGMLGKITDDTDDTDDGWDDGDNIITFAIDVDPGSYDYNPFGDPLTIVGTSSDNQKAIKQALLWDDVMARGLAYSPGNDDADITINTAVGFKAGVGATTYNTIHSILPNDADMFLRADPIVMGNFAWQTVLHEFGHALGFQHPGDYDASDGTFTYENDRTYDEDTIQFTIMSYFEPYKYNPGITWNHNVGPQTPMVYDILAIQDYYGVDTTTRTSDTTYGFNSTADRSVFDFVVNEHPVLTIWDAGGIDTLDLSGFDDDQQVYLEEGMYSDVGGLMQNVAIAFGVKIENAIGGSAKDLIVGNALNNKLTGLAGDDALQGNEGDDILDGGEGNDTLIGNAGFDVLTGGKGDDQLFGNDQDDILTGGAGADFLNGGAGFDIAQYDSPDGENITIRPKSLALGQWTVTGAAQASGDTLTQMEAFRFGAGNDVIGTTGNTVDVSFDLDGGAGNDSITGGDGTDTLIGGSGTDILNPGAGVFQVYGGLRGPRGIGLGESLAANDTLVLDRSGQTASYALYFSRPSTPGGLGTFSDALGSTATGIARLSYTGGSGSDSITGGIGADDIGGGDGADTLSGGTGADTLKGGLGRDYLYGGEGDDRIETGGGGDTSVYGEAGNDTLVGSDDAESLDGGTDDDKLYGYGGANNLYGRDGNDTLDGGLADDFLSGGAGKDTFLFTTSLRSSNVDHITDFIVGDDTIRLDAAVFASFAGGALSASAFKETSAGGAIDANDRILYDKSTGALSYDADGSGTASNALQFAIIDTKALLTAANFLIV